MNKINNNKKYYFIIYYNKMTVIDNVLNDLNPTLYLLFVSSLGGAIRSNIQSCGIQRMIKGNAIVSQLMLLLIIYSLVSKKNIDPVKQIGVTLTIFIVFTVINKNHYMFLIGGMLLLMISYYIENLIKFKYPNKDNIEDLTEEQINEYEMLVKYNKNIQLLSFGIFIIGFIFYFIKQANDKGEQFDLFKFLFGVAKCENL